MDTRKDLKAAWKALRRVVAHALGKIAAWRRGRTGKRTAQKAAHNVASLSLPNHGFWEQGWEFASQAELANTLVEATTSESWMDLARRVRDLREQGTLSPSSGSTVTSLRACRAWAADQTDGDTVAAVAGRASGGRQTAGQPGVLGGLDAKAVPRSCRHRLQDLQEHSRPGTREHELQGNSAAAW